MSLRLPIQRVDQELPLPSYANPGDAGIDLYSAESFTMKPGERKLAPTGIAIAIPRGYAGFVQPKSGRAINEGLGIVNSPGLIDSGYRGEVKVVLINLDPEDVVHVERGQKIAQLVVLAVPAVEILEAETLSESVRGEDGFGSTGLLPG